MKKLIALTLALLLAFSLAACSNDSNIQNGITDLPATVELSPQGDTGSDAYAEDDEQAFEQALQRKKRILCKKMKPLHIQMTSKISR